MAKTQEDLADKPTLISVPDRTARVRRTRGTPTTITPMQIVRQEKAK